MKPIRSLLLVLAALALTTGCTHTTKIRVQPGARLQQPAAGKIPMHVCLVLDPAFSDYEYRFENMGDTWVYPLGATAHEQAISLCQQTFREVTVSKDGTIPPGVDAVLDPEVHRTGYAVGTNGRFMFTLRVEWVLRDRLNQNVLWLTTVDGQATEKRKKVFQVLFDDLANDSHRAFVDSPEIRRLAAGVR